MNDKYRGWPMKFIFPNGEVTTTGCKKTGRLLSITHSGGPLLWDHIQAIKDRVFGSEAVCIEVYPPRSELINNVDMRHIWLLGEDDFYPNLAAEGEMNAPEPRISSLEQWFLKNWGDQTSKEQNEANPAC